MPIKDLIQMARNPNFLDHNKILDAIEMKTVHSHDQIQKRTAALLEPNFSSKDNGVKIIQGITNGSLHHGNFVSAIDSEHTYDNSKGFTWHKIGAPINDENGAIVIKLKETSIINHIKLRLWDLTGCSFSYYAEVSVDKSEWKKIADRPNRCRSWQNLYFEEQPTKYIRIVGTSASAGDSVFRLVSIESKHIKEVPEMIDNILVAKTNVASLEEGATVPVVVHGGTALLNGNFVDYDGNRGYSYHYVNYPGYVNNITIQLCQPFWISFLRILLWDGTSAEYKFCIESSVDNANWEILADRRDQVLSSWQDFHFPSKVMR